MTKADVRKFARVYYDDLMAEFPGVYKDDSLLATWLRLLVLAEKMWPTLPEVPRSVRIKTYQRLVESGLVIPCAEHCYRIRGLDAERTRRQGAARNAAAASWQSRRSAGGNAGAHADAMPRRDETRRDEVTPPPAELGKRANGTNPRAVGTNPRAKGTSPRQEREKQKRAPTRLHEILTSVQRGEKP